MTQLTDVRKQILDEVFSATAAGKIDWTYEGDEDSLQADLQDFQVHFDRKSVSSSPYFKIWLIDASGSVLDDYIIRHTASGVPSGGSFESYYVGVKTIFNEGKEKEKVESLTPFLEKLRGLNN